jgi:SWI/SNF-related matrix-associated actin-dependent regulator 1 of chromatin subfamily A
MILKTDGTKFIAESSYHERVIPKAARFRWDPQAKHWWTDDIDIASNLVNFADEGALAVLTAAGKVKREAILDSRAADWDGDIPCPEGLEYLPYQRAGIAFAMSRRSTLFGDEMGLGKTIQAIGVINSTENFGRGVIVCPASLRLNWQREIEKWCIYDLTIQIIDGGKPVELTGDIIIVNYDVLIKHPALADTHWDLVVCDEAHYMKNAKAKRTKAALTLQGERKLFLTGTPIPNRPIEAWTLVNALDPDTFKYKSAYSKRYCNGHHNGFGWDETGASNLPELQDKMRSTILVRRLKGDVLKELPAKIRQVITVPTTGSARAAVARERAVYEKREAEIEQLRVGVELAKAKSDQDYRDAVASLNQVLRVQFEEMSKQRLDSALEKIDYVIEHLTEALADGRKVVCFAHHKVIVRALQEAFPGSVSITGETPMQQRQYAVDAFQDDAEVKLFIGNIQAAGVGLTLTAASHVVFAELDWVPGNVTQAEDRCHRIGQTDSVLVQHIVLDESLDARLAQSLVHKQNVIDSALDREHEAVPFIAPPVEASSAGTGASALAEEGAEMSSDQIAATHEAVKHLAVRCDRAYEKDDSGYNRIDTAIGHNLAGQDNLSPAQAALARKVVRKYSGQLGNELMERMGS